MMPFIGREHELEHITDAISDFVSHPIIYFDGEWGFGKTLLLQSIEERIHSSLPNYQRFLNLWTFSDLIEPALKQRHFPSFTKLSYEYAQAKSVDERADIFSEIETVFKNEYRHLASSQRVFIYFDSQPCSVNHNYLVLQSALYVSKCHIALAHASLSKKIAICFQIILAAKTFFARIKFSFYGRFNFK